MSTTPNPQDLVEVNLEEIFSKLFRRRWIILGTWLAVGIAAFSYLATTRPVYEASAMLNIEKERGSAGLYTNNGAVIESKNEDYYITQYKLLQRYSLIEKVHKDLNLQTNPEFGGPAGVDLLQRAIKIVPILRSRLVYINARSHDPQTATQVANTLAETYVAENLSNQLFISKDVLRALQVEANNPQARKLYESLPNVVNSTLIQGLKSSYFKLESQAAELSLKVTPKHPEMVALRSNMAALRSQMNEETDRIVSSLKAELSGQLRGNNVRVVEAARAPGTPVLPNRKGVTALAILGGFVLGIALALVVDALDQSVRGEKDVADKLGLPFLGIVPHSKRRGNEKAFQPLLSDEHNFTAESFRSLRTMIGFAGFAGLDGKAKTFLVTSAMAEEGKSFVSANLAVSFATQGLDVLLIDGDLRRPSLHKVLGASTKNGLSDFLAAGKSPEELADLVQETDVPKLKFLACGTRPPNPSELLNTPRTAALLGWANHHYDRVIVDTAPILPIHDTLLWAKHIPSAILVIRHARTRAGATVAASRKLSASGTQVLGVIVNDAKLSGLAYTDRYYYYSKYYSEETAKRGPKPAAHAA